jgi:hypothetical protein
MLFLDLAFSSAFSVMAPNYHAENSGPPLRMLVKSSLDLSTGGPFWLPFWGMFGIIAPQEVGSSAGCAILAPFLLWFYLLIALVLFINLLIAMFNDTCVALPPPRATPPSPSVPPHHLPPCHPTISLRAIARPPCHLALRATPLSPVGVPTYSRPPGTSPSQRNRRRSGR